MSSGSSLTAPAAALIRLVGGVLAEQHDERTEIRRYIGLDVLAESRLTTLDRETTTTQEALPAPINASHTNNGSRGAGATTPDPAPVLDQDSETAVQLTGGILRLSEPPVRLAVSFLVSRTRSGKSWLLTA